MTTLYRLYDSDGNLLYVGISLGWLRRLAQHRGLVAWWEQVATVTMVHFESRTEARAAETAAIKAERPRFNRRPGAARSGLPARPHVALIGAGMYAVSLEGETEADPRTVRAALESHAAATSLASGRMGVTISVEASSASRALRAAIELVEGAAGTFDVVSAEVLTAEEQMRRLELPAIPDLVSLVDVAELAGVSRQRAWQIVEAKSFPPPAVESRGGRMWLRTAVEAYLSRPRRPGRPAAAAIPAE